MSNIEPDTKREGAPEKIGAALGFIVLAVVFCGIVWMMARASGVA